MKPKDLIGPIIALAGTALISSLSFTPLARREILSRDGWRSVISGRSWADGWNLHGSHETFPVDLHKKGWDSNPNNGHAVTVDEHILQEIVRGNIRGARLTHSQHTIRNYDWICAQAGITRNQLSQEIVDQYDEKEPFEYYVEKASRLTPEHFDMRNIAVEV